MPKIVGVRESCCWRPIFDTWFDGGCVIPEHFRDAAKALTEYEGNSNYECTSDDWFKYLRFYIDGPNDNMAKDTEEFIVWCQHVGIFTVRLEAMKPPVLELNKKRLDSMIYDQNVLVVLHHFKDRATIKYCGMGFPTARDIASEYDFDADFVYSVIVWMKCESAFRLNGQIRPDAVDKLINDIVNRNRTQKHEDEPMPQTVQEELTKLRKQLASVFKTSMGSGPPPGEVAASIIYGHATGLAGTEHVEWLRDQIGNAKKLKSEPTRYMQWMKASELLSRVDSRIGSVAPVEDGLLLSNYQQAVERLTEMAEE